MRVCIRALRACACARDCEGVEPASQPARHRQVDRQTEEGGEVQAN